MYRDGIFYDQMAKLAIDIFQDYNLTTFPLNEQEVCRKLGVPAIPYSAYNSEGQLILKKRSLFSFFCPPTKDTSPMIFYNDDLHDVGSPGDIKLNIFHEIKHYVDEDHDELPEDDDLADYFGKYLACPVPYLVVEGIRNPNEIVAAFGISYQTACYVASNVKNRMKKYGYKLFDYEKPLIKQLDPIYYELFVDAEGGVAI